MHEFFSQTVNMADDTGQKVLNRLKVGRVFRGVKKAVDSAKLRSTNASAPLPGQVGVHTTAALLSGDVSDSAPPSSTPRAHDDQASAHGAKDIAEETSKLHDRYATPVFVSVHVRLLSVCLFVCLSVCLFVCLSVCRSVREWLRHGWACLTNILCARVCIYACMHVYVCMYIWTHACLCVCVCRLHAISCTLGNGGIYSSKCSRCQCTQSTHT